MLMHMWQMGRKSADALLRHTRIASTASKKPWICTAGNSGPISSRSPSHASGLQDNTLALRETRTSPFAPFPVVHFIPTIGMRITNKHNGNVLAYSCDTEPCPQCPKNRPETLTSSFTKLEDRRRATAPPAWLAKRLHPGRRQGIALDSLSSLESGPRTPRPRSG